MVLGVRTDVFCTKTVTLRYLTCAALFKVRSVTYGSLRQLTSAGVKLAWLQGASKFCRVESRIHKIITCRHVSFDENVFPFARMHEEKRMNHER